MNTINAFFFNRINVCTVQDVYPNILETNSIKKIKLNIRIQDVFKSFLKPVQSKSPTRLRCGFKKRG